ncbi:MAG TPA: ketopantoate reductase family protein [Syntrophobacteraceae bacterium]|nr:ketopantoate reductase family protein [Syntrophobacteraceae bacterium]
MNILVVGAGAMGSLIGARLSKTRASISLFSTNREHMEAVRQRGLDIEELDGTVSNHRLAAFFEVGKLPRDPDLALVLVKAYATGSALSLVRDICSTSTIFLTLQNGIGNWELIAEITGKESVLAGSTAQGSTLLRAGLIRHGGNGPTYIGEPGRRASERVGRVVELLREAGLVAEPSDGIDRLIWEKLMINVGINAITGLTGIRNGFIAQMQEAADLCRSAVEEAILVAGAKGFPMGDEMVDRVIAVARATARNRSSMGQDVDKKKRTEIDAINGAVVRFAQEAGIPTPVNRTLTSLVKVLEAHYTGPGEH